MIKEIWKGLHELEMSVKVRIPTPLQKLTGGQAFTIIPYHTSCYRCLFPEPPPPGAVPSCQEAGILGVVAGILGVIQATEVLKYILGKGELLTGKLLVFNAREMTFRKLNIERDPQCCVCGNNPSVTELIDYEQFCRLR